MDNTFQHDGPQTREALCANSLCGPDSICREPGCGRRGITLAGYCTQCAPKHELEPLRLTPQAAGEPVASGR
jgi:hypothetical protein